MKVEVVTVNCRKHEIKFDDKDIFDILSRHIMNEFGISSNAEVRFRTIILADPNGYDKKLEITAHVKEDLSGKPTVTETLPNRIPIDDCHK